MRGLIRAVAALGVASGLLVFAPAALAAPTNTKKPVIANFETSSQASPQFVGTSLECIGDTWTDANGFETEYEFLRSGVAIGGFSFSDFYTTTSADAGKSLTCEVKAID